MICTSSPFGTASAVNGSEVLLSYRISQLSPQSTHGLNWKVAIQGPWSDGPANLRDMQVWRSWLELDPDEFSETGPQTKLNWNAIAGIGIATILSGAFWAGLGWMIVRLWR